MDQDHTSSFSLGLDEETLSRILSLPDKAQEKCWKELDQCSRRIKKIMYPRPRRKCIPRAPDNGEEVFGRVVQRIATRYGVLEQSVVNGSSRYLSEARRCLYLAMRCIYGASASYKWLGYLTGKNHTTIIYHVKAAVELPDEDWAEILEFVRHVALSVCENVNITAVDPDLRSVSRDAHKALANN